MKKEIAIIGCMLLSLSGSTQIKTFEAAKPIVKEEKVSYDSTTNFVGENFKALIGQELFVIPKREERQKIGYFGFYINYEHTGNTIAETSTYELYAGKTFIVEEILPRAPYGSDPAPGKNNVVFKIKEKDGNNIYYYVYQWDFPKNFPFIIMGFYEKEKTRCIGKQLVLKDKNPWESLYNEKKPLYDVKSGLQICIDIEDVWTVKELTIDQHYGVLAYMITNAKDECMTVDLDNINDFKRLTGSGILVYDDNLKKIHKETPKFYKNIMEGEIAIGMTREMVRMSWGDPQSSNASSYGDTWVYSTGKILIFIKGILESFS